MVIDAQPRFWRVELGYGPGRVELVLQRIAWLIYTARRLDIPVVITEESAERNGATADALRLQAGGDATVIAKPTFGLTGTPAIVEALQATERRTAVLTGFDTDVCVAQSAVGLQALGLHTVVVADASLGPGGGHEAGLRRIADAGVTVTHTRGLFFEWIATVAEIEAFRRAPTEFQRAPEEPVPPPDIFV